MNVRYRWAWFGLAALLVATVVWTTRYQYEACDTDGCVAIHRWTGSITFREAAWSEPPEEVQVVVARPDPRRSIPGRARVHRATVEVP